MVRSAYGPRYISFCAPPHIPFAQLLRTAHASVCFCGALSHFKMLTSALPRRRGNVVMSPWQRCYAAVATLLRLRSNVVTPPWQRTSRHLDTGRSYSVMTICFIKNPLGVVCEQVKLVRLPSVFAVRHGCSAARTQGDGKI